LDSVLLGLLLLFKTKSTVHESLKALNETMRLFDESDEEILLTY